MIFFHHLALFVHAQWPLILCFFGLTCLLIREEARSTGYGAQITVEELVQKINRGHCVLIDLQHPDQFVQGHIKGARSVELDRLAQQLTQWGVQKTDTVVLLCERGATSSKAVAVLNKLAFDDVTTLRGGMDAWKRAQMPVKKRDNVRR